MAYRTTADLVKGIVEVDETTWPSIEPFILTANELVTEFCAPVVTYSIARLELIERWLSAHFYKVADPAVIQEQIGPVLERRQIKIDLYFSETVYGQQALTLDTHGGLARLEWLIKKGLVLKIPTQVISLDTPLCQAPLRRWYYGSP